MKAETSSSSSSVTSLRTGHARIVAENKALEERMANMMRRNVKLRDSVANYQSVVDEAAQQITKLRRLRQSISRVAAEHSDHQHDVLKQYQDHLERMNKLKKYQQRLILQQISYRAGINLPGYIEPICNLLRVQRPTSRVFKKRVTLSVQSCDG